MNKATDSPPAARPLRVLLVDDAQIILDRLASSLASIDGIDIVGACKTPSQAIATLGASRADLVVLDIQLGAENGWLVLEHIVSQSKNTLVYVFSNDSSTSTRRRFLNGGATCFFDKSLEFNDLHQAVSRLASEHHP